MTETSVFIKTLGDYPLIKILDFLIYSRDLDYPITEIAENSDVNFQTLKKLWPELEKKEMVVITRVLAGATLYKINEKNPIVKKLIEFNNFLCWKEIDTEKEIPAT